MKPGDKVKTTDKWCSRAHSVGVVERVDPNGNVYVYWPRGTVSNYHLADELFQPAGFSEVEHRNPWSRSVVSQFLKVIPEPAIRPGDRVRVKDGHTESGVEGTVLFNKPTNGDDHLVLVTNANGSGWHGFRMSYKTSSLERIDAPVVSSGETYHEAIDNLLPFV